LIKQRILSIYEEEDLDILVIEIGGTVGDLENITYLEAIRELRLELPRHCTANVHVCLVPYNRAVGELKSKPVQHSVKALQSVGLMPDFIVCRSEVPLTEPIRNKISMSSNVPRDRVLSSPDLTSIYELPLKFEEQGLGAQLFGEQLRLKTRLVEDNAYGEWKKTVANLTARFKDTVTIAMPGKYTANKDSYVSINETLKHAAAALGVNIEIAFINTEMETPSDRARVRQEVLACDGVLLTPGFGTRGSEGMILCAQVAIEERVPFLGICFGSQLLYAAYMRMSGLEGANSTETDPDTAYPVVSMLSEQRDVTQLGGSMRLGGKDIDVTKGTLLERVYSEANQTKEHNSDTVTVRERFRHRYHIDRTYLTTEHGDPVSVSMGDRTVQMIVSAVDSETPSIVAAVEIVPETDTDFIVGVQAHPEYSSRPSAPSAPYMGFLRAVIASKH
ncbi:CTP synthase, partial [Kipferlia bialata]